MAKKDIRAALFQSVKERLSAAGIPVAWPNKTFDPSTGTFASVDYLETSDIAVTLGAEGLNRLRGFVQITINTEKDTGEKAKLDLLEALENFYTEGRILEYDGQRVRVTGRARGSEGSNESFNSAPFSIFFRSDYSRQPVT